MAANRKGSGVPWHGPRGLCDGCLLGLFQVLSGLIVSNIGIIVGVIGEPDCYSYSSPSGWGVLVDGDGGRLTD
jgi:hypothetical protein